jgi:hypothetical protein
VQPAETSVPTSGLGDQLKWTMGMMSATVLMGNSITSLPNQLYASRWQVDENSVVYVETRMCG